MSNFTKHPPLQPLPDGKHWRVTEAFEFYFEYKGKKYVVKVTKDYVSDLGSIPKPVWSIIGGPWGKYGYPTIVHDFSYEFKLFPRLICDKGFLIAMKVSKVIWIQRMTIYNFVRWFGWIGWNKRRKQEEVK